MYVLILKLVSGLKLLFDSKIEQNNVAVFGLGKKLLFQDTVIYKAATDGKAPRHRLCLDFTEQKMVAACLPINGRGGLVMYYVANSELIICAALKKRCCIGFFLHSRVILTMENGLVRRKFSVATKKCLSATFRQKHFIFFGQHLASVICGPNSIYVYRDKYLSS